MVAVSWIEANAVGGVKLLVHRSNVERALKILDSIGHSRPENDLPQSELNDSESALDIDGDFGHAGDGDSDRDGPGSLNRLRGMKRIVIGLFLIPVFFGMLLMFSMFLLFLFHSFG